MEVTLADIGSGDGALESGAVRIFAPATVGNAACGFDVFGFALEAPGDEVTARRTREPGARIRSIHGDGGRLPTEPGANSATIAANWLLERHAPQAGVEFALVKGLPLASGMGGSAASAVAAAVAVNTLLGLDLPEEELLAAVLVAEGATAGSAHLDNAAPCLLGGWTLVRSVDPIEVVRLPVPAGLSVALVHPDLEVRTGEARAMLGDTVPLSAAVQQWANTAATVHALHTGDLELLGRAVTDRVAEPVRSRWIPGFQAVVDAAMESGALAASLSGSGPSIFALFDELDAAAAGGRAMSQAFETHARVEADAHVSPVAPLGARVHGGGSPAAPGSGAGDPGATDPGAKDV